MQLLGRSLLDIQGGVRGKQRHREVGIEIEREMEMEMELGRKSRTIL